MTLPAAGARARTSARNPVDPAAWLALPAVIYMTLAYAIPLLILLFAAFRTEHGLSLANFAGFFADGYNCVTRKNGWHLREWPGDTAIHRESGELTH